MKVPRVRDEGLPKDLVSGWKSTRDSLILKGTFNANLNSILD